MDIEVTDAVLTERPNGMLVWTVAYTVNGAAFSHVFPDSTFAWRVAEYGLDPTDTDALLDAVLYEAHLIQDPDHPDALHNAPTIGDARAHYLRQISTVKAAGKLTGRRRKPNEPRIIDPTKIKGRAVTDSNTNPSGTALDLLKQKIRIDPGLVAGMRDVVTRHRAQRRGSEGGQR